MALTTVPASLSATALTLTTAAQPNITSVGTLTGLTLSGALNMGSQNITNGGTLTGSTFTDGYITWNLAQFNRYGAAIELQYTPTNSATLVKIGANGSNPTIFNAYTGAASFSGLVHLDGSGTAERLRISRGTDDSAQFTDFQYNHIELNRSNVALASAQTPLSILQRGSDGVRTVFHVHTDGKVGIGNTSPQRALQVGTYGTGNGEIAIAGSTNGYGSILFGDSASGTAIYDGYLQYNHNDRELLLAAAAVVGAKINSNGDFGIGLLGGTSNPISARLDVVGGGSSTYPTLELVSNTSNTFNHAVNAFNASLTAGENNIIMIGKEGSTKNSGYIGYKWNGAGSDTNQLTFGHWAADNLMNLTANGNLGIGDQSPFSKLQVGSNTFSGSNGMYADSRVGISNHGSLTGLMLASTYNDANYPEYGLVFIQGPSTSSYNTWSISPDGPAKGNRLNFHYQAQSSNIHTAPRMASLDGSGNFYPVGDVVMAQGKGINFGNQADFATGETPVSSILDDYEEGRFTPYIGGSSTVGAWTPTNANGGYYIKVGRKIQVWINATGSLSGAAGTMRLYGLPFVCAANILAHAYNAVYSSGSLQYWSGSGSDVMGPLNYPSTSYLYFHTYNGASNGGQPTVFNGTHNLHCCAVYYTS